MASFILPIISGLAGLFGGKPKTQEQTNTSTTNGTTSGAFNSTNTPLLSDNQTNLSNSFVNGLINRYRNEPVDLSGYTAGGLRDINTGSDLKQKVMANTLASRGLSYSPYAAAASQAPESDRVSQQTQFLDQIPLLKRSLQSQDFDQMIKGFSALPTSTNTQGTQSGTTQSTTDQHGTQISPNNMIGGALSGFGSGLAAPTGQQGGGSNLDNILKHLFG